MAETLSKSAPTGFTRALGGELVNPGPTDTELNPADSPYGDAAATTGTTLTVDGDSTN
ncbi:MAG TPA: hypothetical protein VGN81_20640 [Pseudonocardiaceae bacterium]